MSVTAKKKQTANKASASKRISSKGNPRIIVSDKVGNYEKHPFFVKKANEMKELIKRVGRPKFINED